MTGLLERQETTLQRVGERASRSSVPSRVLLVEADVWRADAIRECLTDEGLRAETVPCGYEAEGRALEREYALVVVDLSLGDRDGVGVCRNLRRLGVTSPILAVTGKAEAGERIRAFEAGADHCLSMPVETEELSARIRALVRRGRANEATMLTFEDVEMDLVRRTVRRSGRGVSLSRREFDLLRYLLQNPNRVLSRTTIAERVWDRREGTQSNVISVYVYMLRKKVDKPFGKRLIHTVAGTGYILSGDGPAA